MAVLEKRPLSLAELDSQTALELPDRETPATVIIGCLAVCVGQIQIKDVDVTVAAQVCAAVTALTVLSVVGSSFTCDVRQH